MFLRAGILSLALLVASRLLGLARETAQAAAFGASGLGDVAVLMLTLPDWLAGVLASGALAYVLLPAWSGQGPEAVRASQRRIARALLAGGVVLAVALALESDAVLDVLVPGLGEALRPAGRHALLWSVVALPLALLAALWTTRLQHERDFTGMYGANLVVNAVLIATLGTLAVVASRATAASLGGAAAGAAVLWLGLGLLAAMLGRLAWLHARQRPHREQPAAMQQGAPQAATQTTLVAPNAWLWAAFAAGLPLALPFAARSIASGAGEGALATFNYAWKLVELPLQLAIQLVATLAFPAIARTLATQPADAATAIRPAFALGWTLACAAAAALLVAAPALAQILFGWGRMDPQAIARVAEWGRIAAWGLLPQSLIAVALTVLATQRKMHPAVLAYGAALVALLLVARTGIADGAVLMGGLNAIFTAVAVVVVAALGRGVRDWMPWRAIGAAAFALALCAAGARWATDAIHGAALALQLALAVVASAFVAAIAFVVSADVRAALRR